MTTATKTYTVHRKHTCVAFDDLPRDMQKRILDRYASEELDGFDWWDSTLDWFCTDTTDKYGLNVNGRKCYFSLYPTSATWTLDSIEDVRKFVDALGFTDERERAYLMAWADDTVKFSANPSPRGTCQYSGVECWPLEEDEVEDPTTIQGFTVQEQEALFLRIERAWDKLAANIAHELGKLMEYEYEWLTSEKYLRERMEENGDIFDIETGMVFNREDAEEE